MNTNILAKEFTAKSLIMYAMPTIFMMVFMATYLTVDGMFVAKFVNEDALSAVNIVMPALNLVLAVGLMLSTGANAIVGRFLGEGRDPEAREFLTLIYLVGAVFGITITVIALSFPHQILGILGTSETLYPYAKDYLIALSVSIPLVMFQMFTQAFFVSAGKPMLGLISCIVGGVTNVILDYVFIVIFELGITGAGLATGIGFAIPGVFGLVYFSVCRKGSIYFVKTKWNPRLLGQSLYNGLSECVNNISVAITTLMFNVILLDMRDEAGVAAISVILYIQMVQSAIYMGYSGGVGPVLSYKYGAQNHQQMHMINRVSFKVIAVASVLVIALSILFAGEAVGIFIDPDSPTFAMAKEGLIIFSSAYIFMGFNVYTSAMFTALSNGKVSAILSAGRSLVFIVISLLILPHYLGIIGVWLAVPIAEFFALLMSIWYYKKNKKNYNY